MKEFASATTVMDSTVRYTPTAMEIDGVKTEVTDLINTYFPEHLSECIGIDDMFYDKGYFWEAKGWIINAMRCHPCYNGNYQIVLRDQEVRHERGLNTILDFKHYVWNYCDTTPGISIAIADIFESILICAYRNGEYIDKDTYDYCSSIIFKNELWNKFNMHNGEKITKLIGRLAKLCGIDKHSDMREIQLAPDGIKKMKDFGWKKRYSDFCNAMTTRPVKETVVISVHPVDYYTSAFGDSWSTCYTIDKNNIREVGGGYSGAHCNATQSHMLDKSTVVVYTLKDYNGQLPESLPKRRCCLFYLGEDKIIQGRVYPDGIKDELAYCATRMIREIVQKTVSELWHIPNDWEVVVGNDACDEVIEYHKPSIVYPDCSYFKECSVSYLKRVDGYRNENHIIIGADVICPECGMVHYQEDNLFCNSCYLIECHYCDNKSIESDMYMDDGGYYCCNECKSKGVGWWGEDDEDDEDDEVSFEYDEDDE